MKLSNKEKGILAVFLAIVIMAVGAFMLVVPEYQKIDGNKASLEDAKVRRDQLYNNLTRESTIDQELKDALEAAKEYSRYFYDDMTTYQADETFREILKNGGISTDSLRIGEFTTSTLSLSTFVKTFVTYPLKEYSGYQETADSVLNQYELNYDENGNIIEDEAFMAIYEELSSKLLKDLKRLQLSAENQTIGSITADFSVTCTRQQYLDFLDYVHALERATYIHSAEINYTKASVSAETEAPVIAPIMDENGNPIPVQPAAPNPDDNIVKDTDESTYSITMTLYCVKELQTEDEAETDGAEQSEQTEAPAA